MNLQLFYQGIAPVEKEIEIRQNEPMSVHTTFQVGGPAEVFALPHTERALAAVLKAARVAQAELTVIGRGSNLLVRDEGVRGVVVCTCALNGIRVEGDCITAFAGATMAQLAQTALRVGLTGAEFAAGIPGTVGGGAFMNAGAYDGEMKNIVTRTIYLDENGRLGSLQGEENAFGYRTSAYKSHPERTIVSVQMELKQGDPAQIRAKMEDFAARRREKQPLSYPSAGSTFKRPTGYFAGQLIENAGLKGFTVGGAQVSEKHAGFVINCGGATCADLMALIAEVQRRVKENSGVELECEIRLIG